MVKRAWLATAVALLAWAAPAAAQTADAESGAAQSAAAPTGEAPSWAYELASDLMSPFCPGRTLADCPSPAAASIRMWIIVQAAAGRTRADVEEELYERYGDVIRAAPRAEGFGVAAYAVPVAVFTAGGLLVAFVLRRMTRGAPRPQPVAPYPADAELERIVDEDLAR